MTDNKISKDFLIYMIRTAIMALGPVVMFPYATRILGTVGIGRVQYIQSIASYFQLAASFGIASYGLREGAKIRDDKERLGKLVSELIVLNLITTAVALTAYILISQINIFQNYKKLLWVFSLYVVFYGLNLDWVYNVLQDYVFITKRSVFSFLISFAVMLLLLRSRDDELIYAIVIILPYMLNCLWNFYGITRRIKLFSGFRLQLKIHIRPCILLFSIIISSSIYSLLDTTMLGIMMNDEAVGLYTAASKLAKLLGQFTTAICTVFAPRLSYQVGRGNSKEFRELAKNASNIITLIAIPCAVGLWTFSRQAIEIFSGAEFIPASGAMKILSLNLIFSTLDYLLGWQILVPNNKDNVLFIATLVGAASDFILNLLFVPRLGVQGAAAATLLAEFSVFVICFAKSREYMDMGVLVKHCLKCLVSAFPIILTGLWLSNYTLSAILTFCIAVPLSALLYTVFLYILKDESIRYVVNVIIDKINIHGKVK
ncbi:MAG: flippase [Lachnospiraceae bacterium]|nr:flippase [Lachnospiraceae bacterium]